MRLGACRPLDERGDPSHGFVAIATTLKLSTPSSSTGTPDCSSARITNGSASASATAPSTRWVRASWTCHGARPARHAQLVAHRQEPRRQRAQRIAPAVEVADIAVGGEREVHRPDEHRAVALLPSLVEGHVAPHAAADPHQPHASHRHRRQRRPRRAGRPHRETPWPRRAPIRCRDAIAAPSSRASNRRCRSARAARRRSGRACGGNNPPAR